MKFVCCAVHKVTVKKEVTDSKRTEVLSVSIPATPSLKRKALRFCQSCKNSNLSLANLKLHEILLQTLGLSALNRIHEPNISV